MAGGPGGMVLATRFDQLAVGVSKVAGVDLITAALKKVAPVVLDEIEGQLSTGLGLLDEIAGFH